MEAISRLGIGPMSREIIEAVYSYSHTRNTPLMLIASKNQIDYDRGYVFKTSDYRQYLDQMKRQYSGANVYICRDHCGPGHNSVFELEDTYKTIEADIANGFDLIHVDFCFHSGPHKEILDQSKKAIQFIHSQAPRTMIEVGTDENTATNIEDTLRAEASMKYFTSFCEPHFFVLQTGTIIKEDRQEGIFHEDYVKKLHGLASKYGVLLKEHNADYLPASEIQRRKNLVGAVNVAPQFGVLQTQLTLFKAKQYGIDPSEFIDVSYRSRKWEKWLNRNDEHNRLLCTTIAGHYNFNSDAYKRLFDEIMQHENFNAVIQQEMHRIFDHYVLNLEGLSPALEEFTIKRETRAV
ncbi:MAG: hypothetical protein WEC84_01260 [Candidatus Andersenbacteria bacterium]